MVTVVAVALFGGALAVAGYALLATVLPYADRIGAVLRGDAPTARFEPLASLVQAERRIAVRRWAGSAAASQAAYAPARRPQRCCEAA